MRRDRVIQLRAMLILGGALLVGGSPVMAATGGARAKLVTDGDSLRAAKVYECRAEAGNDQCPPNNDITRFPARPLEVRPGDKVEVRLRDEADRLTVDFAGAGRDPRAKSKRGGRRWVYRTPRRLVGAAVSLSVRYEPDRQGRTSFARFGFETKRAGA